MKMYFVTSDYTGLSTDFKAKTYTRAVFVPLEQAVRVSKRDMNKLVVNCLLEKWTEDESHFA